MFAAPVPNQSFSQSEYDLIADSCSAHTCEGDRVLYFANKLVEFTKYAEDRSLYYSAVEKLANVYFSLQRGDAFTVVDSLASLIVDEPDLRHYSNIQSLLIGYDVHHYKYKLAMMRLDSMRGLVDLRGCVSAKALLTCEMAQVYWGTEHYELSKVYYESALELLTHHGNCVDLHAYFKIVCEAISDRRVAQDYYQMLYLIEDLQNHLDALDYSTSTKWEERKDYEEFEFFMTCNKLFALSKLKQPESARRAFDCLNALHGNHTTPKSRVQYCAAVAVYDLLQGQNLLALQAIDTALAYSTSLVDEKGYTLDRINILKELKDFKQLSIAYASLSSITDTLESIQSLEQLDEVTILHRRDQLSHENYSMHKKKFLLSTIILLLLASLALLVWITLKSKQKYTAIFGKVQACFTLQQQLAKRQTEIAIANKETHINRRSSLFESLELQMRQSMLFKDPNISRENIAELLNTNRAYLISVIKENTGCSFVEYVNQFRLNYAKDIICNNAHLSVQEISKQAGYFSFSSFCKQFENKFGLTPEEMREQNS